MREYLLGKEGESGIQLAKTQINRECAYSGDEIPKGKHGLRLLRNDHSSNKDMTYSSWVSLDNWTDVLGNLQRFDFENNTPPEKLSPSRSIAYREVSVKVVFCCACGKQMNSGTEGVEFVNPEDSYRISNIWLHIDCIQSACNALREIDEYTTELVSETI